MKLRMKYLGMIAAVALCASLCFADMYTPRFKITESRDEFDVIYFVNDELQFAKNNKNKDVKVTETFKFRGKDGIKAEVRYSLFTDIDPDGEDIQFHYALWICNLLNIVAGYDFPVKEVLPKANQDVRNDFNGNNGCSAFVVNPKSDYGRGYKYMRVEFFYKNKQGLVMRTFLFNDLKFTGFDEKNRQFDNSSDYNNNYYTFWFMDKDENGKFIRK